MAMKKYKYCCPWCKTHVSSAIHTGCVDHRTVCGNQFHVKDGVISAPNHLYHYVCPRCNTHVRSTVCTGKVDQCGACGKRYRVHDGQVAMKKHRYCCPWCKTHVSSAIHTGRVDHRTVCGNQFHVQEGVVAAATRRYAHRCPVCRTVVWSSLAFGRLRIAHASPSGKPCPNQAWNVPNKTTNRKKGTGGK